MTMLDTRARLQSMLAGDQWHRSHIGAWPPPVTVAPVTRGAAIARRRFNPMPHGPLRLTDDQLAAVMRAAEPLAIGDRDAFLQAVSEALRGQELGDGMVFRVIVQVQKRFFDPPIMASPTRWG